MTDEIARLTTKLNASQLKWHCRRGMLELDILLGNFLHEAYLQLSPPDQILFAKLLDYSDPELFSWLLGQEIPNDTEINKMIRMVRIHAQSRVSASSL